MVCPWRPWKETKTALLKQYVVRSESGVSRKRSLRRRSKKRSFGKVAVRSLCLVGGAVTRQEGVVSWKRTEKNRTECNII